MCPSWTAYSRSVSRPTSRGGPLAGHIALCNNSRVALGLTHLIWRAMEIRSLSLDFSQPVSGSGPRSTSQTVVFSREVLRAVAGLSDYLAESRWGSGCNRPACL
jgi:hypothetical protein